MLGELLQEFSWDFPQRISLRNFPKVFIQGISSMNLLSEPPEGISLRISFGILVLRSGEGCHRPGGLGSARARRAGAPRDPVHVGGTGKARGEGTAMTLMIFGIRESD